MIEDGRGMLPLHWAAAFGRTGPNIVKRLIEEYPQALVHTTVDGDIPLHLAVANATIEEEEGGRRGNAVGRASGSDGKVDKNRLKIVELLMHDAGRKISARDGDVTSPILMTNKEKVSLLLLFFVITLINHLHFTLERVMKYLFREALYF